MYNICLSVETKKSQYFVLQEFIKYFFLILGTGRIWQMLPKCTFFKSLFRKNLMSITDP